MILELSDLETLCDKEGNEVIAHLMTMCVEKADHVKQYAGSENISKAWTRAAKALEVVHFPY